MAPPSQPLAFGDRLERWLNGPGEKTLGRLVNVFGQKGFATVFVVLLAVPALPLPTGGATHVFEVAAMLLALQLIAGRDRIWLPRRWRRLSVGGEGRQRFVTALVRTVRWLERRSRPRLAFVFGHRLSNVAFGSLAFAGSLAAFLAPPFSGLDTLPALAVVLLSLGVVLEDFALAALAIAVGVAGVILEVVLWGVAVDAFDWLLGVGGPVPL